mmetsp:Transcript_21116/g.64314  ORF Transcript_21116/g.64314 Transcript_21116/m.64314 type:complete len:148 (-) Transcript_21116:659-1102(-)
MDGGDAKGLAKVREAAEHALMLDPGNQGLDNIAKQIKSAISYQNAEVGRLKELQRTYERVLAVHERDGDAVAMQVRVKEALAQRKVQQLSGMVSASIALRKLRKRAALRTGAPSRLSLEQFDEKPELEDDDEDEPVTPTLARSITWS